MVNFIVIERIFERCEDLGMVGWNASSFIAEDLYVFVWMSRVAASRNDLVKLFLVVNRVVFKVNRIA